ncbi:hypothetical protein L596_000881 [Steinernema carpocapsae]|uniref:Hcy-binding domain-containing protein n=1 Tax=Steinernema carpocapsae TaxID=34508 RepID=A0A4U8ULQ8_STECR|nr:hypothetical protein L596_000881 [Steinernema carpocapsae]
MIQREHLEENDFRADILADHYLPLKGNNDLLSLYLESGADFIETNTFSGTAMAQADHGCEGLVNNINRKSAELAKKACEVVARKTGSNIVYIL